MSNDVKLLIQILEKDINFSTSRYKEREKEIIVLLKQSTIDEKMKYDVLVELFKFIKIGDTITSVDGRGDTSIKLGILSRIKESIEKNTLNKEIIEDFKAINELCLSYILDPLKLTREMNQLYVENSDLRF